MTTNNKTWILDHHPDGMPTLTLGFGRDETPARLQALVHHQLWPKAPFQLCVRQP